MPYWRLFYHLIWATKERHPLIDPDRERIIERSMRSTIDTMKGIPHAIGFMPDHVHVALSIPPSVSIADVVARLKGSSAHAVNEARPGEEFRWRADYGVLSFGEKNLPDIVDDVRNQAKRHGDLRL